MKIKCFFILRVFYWVDVINSLSGLPPGKVTQSAVATPAVMPSHPPGPWVFGNVLCCCNNTAAGTQVSSSASTVLHVYINLLKPDVVIALPCREMIFKGFEH